MAGWWRKTNWKVAYWQAPLDSWITPQQSDCGLVNQTVMLLTHCSGEGQTAHSWAISGDYHNHTLNHTDAFAVFDKLSVQVVLVRGCALLPLLLSPLPLVSQLTATQERERVGEERGSRFPESMLHR